MESGNRYCYLSLLKGLGNLFHRLIIADAPVVSLCYLGTRMSQQTGNALDLGPVVYAGLGKGGTKVLPLEP